MPDAFPGRDPLDESIRELLTRSVAEAPPPPTPAEITHPAVAPTNVVPLGEPSRSRWTWLGNGGGRTLRAAAASIVVLALVVAGASLSDRLGGPDNDPSSRMADGPVRFAPSELPEGFELVAADEATDLPLPEVAVYEGPLWNLGDVSVRIVVDPLVTADFLTAMATSDDGGGGPSGTVSAAPTGSVPTTGTTAGPTTTTTTGPPDGESSGTTTSVPDDEFPNHVSVPPPRGVLDVFLDPADEGTTMTRVRGVDAAVEAHDELSTTVWFWENGILVAVDVTGVDQDAALDLVETLVPPVGGDMPTPRPRDELTLGDDLPATTSESAASLRYAIPGQDDPGTTPLVVTSIALPGDRRDLLTATAGWSGRVADWDGRQVLVDTVDASTGSRGGMVAFVDPSGVLVIVQGPVDDLRPTVESLEVLDGEAWAAMTGGVVASTSSEPPTAQGPSGPGGDPSTTTPGGETTEGTGGPTTTAFDDGIGDGGTPTTVTTGVSTTQSPDTTSPDESGITPPPTGPGDGPSTTTSIA